jgi:hypothetical protein
MRKLAKEHYFELAVFCMHYHSGQWSRGYRILSKLQLRNLTSAAKAEAVESEAYQWLVEHYGEAM